MKSNGIKRTYSIRITVLTLFILMTLATSGLILGLEYYFSSRIAKKTATDNFQNIAANVSEKIINRDRQVSELVDMLRHFDMLGQIPEPGKRHPAFEVLINALEQNPNLYAIQVGYDTGSYYEVINLESGPEVKQAYNAQKEDRWLVIKVIPEIDGTNKHMVFLNRDYDISIVTKAPSRYDPRKRTWYKKAILSQKVEKSEPYFFANLKSPGVTIGGKIKNTNHVVAADMTRRNIHDFLSKQRFLPSCEIFVFNEKGEILFFARPQTTEFPKEPPKKIDLSPEEKAYLETKPHIRVSNELDWPPFDFAPGGLPAGYSIDLLNLIAQQTGLTFEFVNGYSWQDLETMFRSGEIDLLHSLVKTPERQALGSFTTPYANIPPVAVTRNSNFIVSNLKQLNDKSIAIPHGWGSIKFIEQNFPQINIIKTQTTLEAMALVEKGGVEATIDSDQVLRYLKKAYFMESLNVGPPIKDLAKTDAHTLHFLVQKNNTPLFGILEKGLAVITLKQKKSLRVKWGLEDENSSIHASSFSGHVVPHKTLRDMAATPDKQQTRTIMVRNTEFMAYTQPLYGMPDQFIGIIVSREEVLSPYLKKIKLAIYATIGCVIFFLPLIGLVTSFIVAPIRALVIENKKVKERRWEDISEVDSKIKEIKTLSRSMKSMATSIRDHEKAQEHFMDSLIKLIASTIDQKSPYTGGHCERVPEIAVLLAQAAEKSDDPVLADFRFKTREEWREFEVAAWLHDCGKIVTPEHIVDKGTKLEVIYNRIHEIRMRYEVLLRDAQIEYWKAKADDSDTPELSQKLSDTEDRLQDEFAFIAGCNIGGEFMDPEKVDQLKKIASQTWTRHFDDSIGLSHIEADLFADHIKPVPCEEKILDDRPEHILARDLDRYKDDDKFGFNMPVPELTYNQGELYNLGIGRGTLTAEDRYIIQEHITATIRMLDILPFPDELARVPEYAGAHHETLTGEGYPRKLKKEQISIPGRILAIADIFEALTASDRPYKKAKPLSVAIRIMAGMRDRGHIDPDLFKVFLVSGAYMTYAKKFLKPEQVEEVNISDYL